MSGVLSDERLSYILTCVVCSKLFDEPITTDCGHTFCRSCIEPLENCPECNSRIAPVEGKIETKIVATLTNTFARLMYHILLSKQQQMETSSTSAELNDDSPLLSDEEEVELSNLLDAEDIALIEECATLKTKKRKLDQDNAINVLVACPRGTSVFDVKRTDKVSKLKKMIRDKENISTCSQRLIYSGKQLEDDETLEYYNITNDSLIHMNGRLRGAKPVIMLYPRKTVQFSIDVELPRWCKMSSQWPKGNESDGEHVNSKVYSWEGFAGSNGILCIDGLQHPYIFYEFIVQENVRESLYIHAFDPRYYYDDIYDFDVTQPDPEPVFQTSIERVGMLMYIFLTHLGLNTREANDMITFWLPKMEDHNRPYINLQFLTKRYSQNIPLRCTPEPEVSLRVYMIFQGSMLECNDRPDHLTDEVIGYYSKDTIKDKRDSNTVLIEWGGADITYAYVSDDRKAHPWL